MGSISFGPPTGGLPSRAGVGPVSDRGFSVHAASGGAQGAGTPGMITVQAAQRNQQVGQQQWIESEGRGGQWPPGPTSHQLVPPQQGVAEGQEGRKAEEEEDDDMVLPATPEEDRPAHVPYTGAIVEDSNMDRNTGGF